MGQHRNADLALGARLFPSLCLNAAMTIGNVVMLGAVLILGPSLATLLEGVPDGTRVQSVVESVKRQSSADAMHHVHMWQLGPRQHALTAHRLVRGMDIAQAGILCKGIRCHPGRLLKGENMRALWWHRHSCLC